MRGHAGSQLYPIFSKFCADTCGWPYDGTPAIAERRRRACLKGRYEDPEFSALMCSYMWVDDDTIGALVIPESRGAAPEKLPIPLGPNVQDNSSGKTSQVRLFCTDPEGA